MGLAYQQKRLKAQDYSRKQLKTANGNSPWAYIREGLLSEGYLRLRFGGLIFGRAYFFLRGGGGEGLLPDYYGVLLRYFYVDRQEQFTVCKVVSASQVRQFEPLVSL